MIQGPVACGSAVRIRHSNGAPRHTQPSIVILTSNAPLFGLDFCFAISLCVGVPEAVWALLSERSHTGVRAWNLI